MYNSSLEAQRRIDEWIQLKNPLEILNLSELGLTELPKIPSDCQKLWCFRNKLTVLPELPNCRQLYCGRNQLTILPELPNCQILNCFGSQTTVLPKLPNCRELYCGSNKLTVLPKLDHCQILDCHNNQLTVLPELPNCQRLCCSYNQLTVLPELHNCQVLNCDDNEYLWITKKCAKKYGICETPNYFKCAAIVQRTYRKYIIRKYQLLNKYLLKDTIKVVCSYIA
jgi:Leucine-rich repeat (LRR) protein